MKLNFLNSGSSYAAAVVQNAFQEVLAKGSTRPDAQQHAVSPPRRPHHIHWTGKIAKSFDLAVTEKGQYITSAGTLLFRRLKGVSKSKKPVKWFEGISAAAARDIRGDQNRIRAGKSIFHIFKEKEHAAHVRKQHAEAQD